MLIAYDPICSTVPSSLTFVRTFWRRPKQWYIFHLSNMQPCDLGFGLFISHCFIIYAGFVPHLFKMNFLGFLQLFVIELGTPMYHTHCQL